MLAELNEETGKTAAEAIRQAGGRALFVPCDVHEQHPAGRVGTPADIARACLYLTHPDNTFVTGTHLVVDGGMTRKMIYEP